MRHDPPETAGVRPRAFTPRTRKSIDSGANVRRGGGRVWRDSQAHSARRYVASARRSQYGLPFLHCTYSDNVARRPPRCLNGSSACTTGPGCLADFPSTTGHNATTNLALVFRWRRARYFHLRELREPNGIALYRSHYFLGKRLVPREQS